MVEKLNVVVTGGNSGVGLSIAKALAENDHSVISISRRIPESSHRKLMDHVYCDLSDFDFIHAAVEQIRAMMPKIDGLIFSAGQLNTDRAVDRYGFDPAYTVGFLGHFKLALALAPALAASQRPIFINITSRAVRSAGKRSTDAPFGRPKSVAASYERAKAALLAFGCQAARGQIAGLPALRVMTFEPPMMETGLVLDAAQGHWRGRLGLKVLRAMRAFTDPDVVARALVCRLGNSAREGETYFEWKSASSEFVAIPPPRWTTRQANIDAFSAMSQATIDFLEAK